MIKTTFSFFLIFAVVLLFSNQSSSTNNRDVVFSSGDKQVVLIELYTSQGCSSCPPAERWFNQLLEHPKLWRDYVPVAFHVDYWDRLGWLDPFASKANTRRQYQYNREGDIGSVYTPCFVANGQEWRGWYQGDKLPATAGRAPELTGKLRGNIINVDYSGTTEELELNVVVLGVGLTTRVKKGENRKKTLTQDFVALSHEIHKSSSGHWRVSLPKFDPERAQKFGLAIWVNKPGDLTPLQAAGGWL